MVKAEDYSSAHAAEDAFDQMLLGEGGKKLAREPGIVLVGDPKYRDANTINRVYWLGYEDGKCGRDRSAGYAGELLDSYEMGHGNGAQLRRMETASTDPAEHSTDK